MNLSPQKEFSPNGENSVRERSPLIYGGRIREHLHLEGVDKMILGVGDCRTGTTAWLAAASRIGFPAYYQPGKAAMRCMMQEGYEPEDIYFAQPGKPIVVAKETIGPQNIEECTLNPVRTYKYDNYDNRGLNPSQLHVVFFIRNPVAILRSWHKIFGPGSSVSPMDLSQLIHNFVHSAQKEREIYSELVMQEIPHTVFAQELLEPPEGIDQATHSARVMQTIFERAGITVSDEAALFAVSDWQKEGVENLKARIKFPREPHYNYEGGIYPTLASKGYQFVPQQVSLDDLTDDERSVFQTTDLIGFYNDLLPVSAQHLLVERYDHLSLW